MIDYFLDWISLFFRWFHVIAGVAWIGASFYFVWLDNNLRTPPEWKQKKGIKGDLWAIHGGGFYEIAKYNLGPEKMPETLHWFKWEAYTTWLTGMAMLIIVYYVNAQSYMVSPSTGITSPALSIVVGLALIGLTVAIYEMLLRTPVVDKGLYFAAVMVGVITLLSYTSFQLFSERAAFIHVGAAIGSIMVANVFFGIVPSQRHFVDAVTAGTELDTHKIMQARLRSLHNNYFTLPVIFIMISNHYAFIYGHEYGWLLLICIGVIMAYARHYFNLKNRGINKPSVLVIAFIAAVVLMVILKPAAPKLNDSVAVDEQQVLQIMQTHCSACHAAQPSQAGFNAPPLGLKFETLEQLAAEKDRVMKAVVNSNIMPLGNMTGMTQDERDLIAAWLNQAE